MKCGTPRYQALIAPIIAFWMIKFKVKANMNSVLDKVQAESLMPLEYKYLLHVLLNLENKASSS